MGRAGWRPNAGGAVEFALLFVVAGYVIRFCVSTPARQFVFRWLLLPDSLLMEWLGNDIARFGVIDRVPVLLGAGAILAVGLLTGRLLLDALQVARLLTTLEQIVISCGLGMNVLSLLTLAMGLAGQLHSRWWFVAAAVVVVGLAALRCSRWRRSPPATVGASEPGHSPRMVFYVVLAFALLILLGGMLPPWHFDVREYHLEIPKEWQQRGASGFVPHNVYGNMPLGAEMHALLGMVLMPGPRSWWWGALVGKTVIAVFAPLTALAVFVCGRRFLGAGAGAYAALLFVSCPWVAHVSMSGLIDVVSAFYFVSAVHAALLWSSERRKGVGGFGEKWGLPAIAGFLAGSAVSCKYPAVVFLVVPLVLWFACARPGWPHGKTAAVVLLATAASCGLWLGKNWVLCGNPTYPLLYEWFDGRTRTPDKDAQWNRAHGPPRGPAGERFAPGQMKDSLSLIAWRSQYASPLLVPFAAIGLFARRRARFLWALAGWCIWAVAMWWLLTHRVDRFLLPILPLVSLLAGAGVVLSDSRPWRVGVCGLLGFGLAFNFLFDACRLTSDNRFLVALEDLRQDLPHAQDPDYNHVHPAHRFLNETVRPGYQIMAVGEAQVFDFDMPVLYNTCFDDCVFQQLLKGRTREERSAALRAQRISHIFIFWLELQRYRSPGNYGYSDYVTPDLIWREFVQDQQLLRKVPLDISPENSEVFEVVGWRDW